mgnify:CR=1 FL=1
MAIQESGENYLETILILKERNGYVRSIDIAHETGFSKPSVSRAVSILKKEGLVEIDPLNQILLTDKGREIAEGIYERHRVLTKFFEHIGVDADVAAADACKIEHIISSQTFERIKEKLIGETFEYAPKFDYIINGILIRYEDDPDLERFYRTNINLIISTFKKSGTRNLRILKHALKDFQKIYQVVTQKYPDISNRVIQTMLIFTIAISFEIKAGKVTKDKFIDIKNNEEYKAILVSSRVLMDNRQFYIKEFDNNYYYNFKAEYRFFKFIEYYVRTRIFDMKLLKNDMAEIQNTGENRNVPAYKRLLTEEYWKIPDEEFLKVINDIIKEIKSGKVELIELVKLYSYFSYFSSKKLIPYESETIKKIFEDSMDLVAQKSEYYEIKKDEFTEFALVQNQKDMQKILNKFYEINESLKEKAFGKKAEEIFKCIPMKMEQFYDRFDKECMEIPIFRYYEPRNVLQRLMYSSNEDLVTIKDKMIKRAELYSELLLEEKDNLIKLREVIREYIKDKTASIKIVMLEEFAKSLDYILEKYDQNLTKNEK